MSERKACTMMRVSRTVYRYAAQPRNDAPVIEQLQRLASHHPGYGFWKMNDRLHLEGYRWNHKKIYRVYTELKLNIRRRHKRRLPAREKTPLAIPQEPNHTWSMDYMTDTLYNGRRVRILNIMDDYNRQALAMEVDFTLPSQRVITLLERLKETYGKPQIIRTDNGPEFISHKLLDWCHRQRIQLQFIQPGKPMQNGLIERFNGTYRKEILDAYVFYSLGELRTVTEQWMHEYNHNRPHDSLNKIPPIQYVLNYGKLATAQSPAQSLPQFNTANNDHPD